MSERAISGGQFVAVRRGLAEQIVQRDVVRCHACAQAQQVDAERGGVLHMLKTQFPDGVETDNTIAQRICVQRNIAFSG
jgi:hypothetical protein